MHEKLVVWMEAYALCKQMYEITACFPSHERFGLISQMRRSSFSVPANIAEGNVKQSHRDKKHFLEIASASLEELHMSTLLARDLTYITDEVFDQMDDRINRISYLLMKFSRSLTL